MTTPKRVTIDEFCDGWFKLSEVPSGPFMALYFSVGRGGCTLISSYTTGGGLIGETWEELQGEVRGYMVKDLMERSATPMNSSCPSFYHAIYELEKVGTRKGTIQLEELKEVPEFIQRLHSFYKRQCPSLPIKVHSSGIVLSSGDSLSHCFRWRPFYEEKREEWLFKFEQRVDDMDTYPEWEWGIWNGFLSKRRIKKTLVSSLDGDVIHCFDQTSFKETLKEVYILDLIALRLQCSTEDVIVASLDNWYEEGKVKARYFSSYYELRKKRYPRGVAKRMARKISELPPRISNEDFYKVREEVIKEIEELERSSE